MEYYKLVDSGVQLTDEGKHALDILGITLGELPTYPDEQLTASYWQGCKTYVDQAMKNGKGITWLDAIRIPYESSRDREAQDRPNVLGKKYGGDNKGAFLNEFAEKYGCNKIHNNQGRFPANLLVSDDVLNDGRDFRGMHFQKSGHHKGSEMFGGGNINGTRSDKSGSFSRYFDLDKWAQKTFPFLIVPKASKSEKNRGCEELPMMPNNITGEWEYSTKGKSIQHNNHPTVKPLKLMSYLVTLGSRQGDTVLDSFMGTGTTGLACQLLGREFIGYEINKDYFEIATHRLNGQKVMELV